MKITRLAAALAAASILTLASNAHAQNLVKSGGYYTAGSGVNQYGLPVITNTTLTVPAGAGCAYITVEGANVRRTSDGTSATTSVGTLFTSGTQWADCGPLTQYKFTAVSGSPTLDVEYFK